MIMKYKKTIPVYRQYMMHNSDTIKWSPKAPYATILNDQQYLTSAGATLLVGYIRRFIRRKAETISNTVKIQANRNTEVNARYV